MSAAFKNAKKKLSQVELRRFMNDHKVKTKTTKVESPLAKYNDLGQLTCVLCQTVVRSESVWNVHVNSKQHRDNVDEAKRLKETTNNFTTPLKRCNVTPIEVSNKKLKSILKNSANNNDSMITDNDDILSHTNLVQTQATVSVIANKEHEVVVEAKGDSAVIPEGFFDDPKQDAKVRHIDYKDPIEEEWEKFQRVIRDANNESASIIAEDHEEATNERQLDEIDEQMKNWSKVLTLERKKTEVKFASNSQSVNSDQSEVSDDEINFEEYLDWRTKKCFTV